MARLIVALFLLLPVFAHADPATIAFALLDAGASAGFALGAAAFIESYGAILAFTSVSLYLSASARRKQQAAANAIKNQEIANLADRTLNVLDMDAPWQTIYGNPAPVGGSIAAVLTSGNVDQFKHIVLVFAAHECESVDQYYCDGIALTLDSGGYVVSAVDPITGIADTEFAENGGLQTITENIAFDSSGNATLGHVPTQLVYAGIFVSPSGNIQDGFTQDNSIYYPVVLSGGAGVSGGPANQTIQVCYEYEAPISYINIQTHLGAGIDVADPYLIAACPGQWTPAHKISGCCYAVISVDLTHPRFQSPPTITARIKGKKLYDHRTGLTAYSRNNALALLDFIMSAPGFKATAAQIDMNSADYAANVCDFGAYTTAPGGSNNYFVCDGAFLSDQSRDQTLQDLCDSFSGSAFRSGGVWTIQPGTWTTPVATLNPVDAAGPIQVTQSTNPASQRYNTCRGTFFSSDDVGTSKDYTPYQNSVFFAADGAEFPASKNFPFTANNQRCQDLARTIVEKSRGGLTINLPSQLSVFQYQPGDRFYINNSDYGFVNETFKMTDYVYSQTAPIALQLVRDVPAYYDLADEVNENVAPSTSMPNPFIQPSAPANLNVLASTDQLSVMGDGTIVSNALVEFQQSTDTYVLNGGQAQIRYRNSLLPEVWPPTLFMPGDAVQATIANLIDLTPYLFQARFVNAYGKASNWASIGVTVLGKSAPPPDMISLQINGTVLSWPAVTGVPDLAGYVFRFHYGSNTNWDTASALDGDSLVGGFTTKTSFSLVHRPAGIVTIMGRCIDTSGNVSGDSVVVVTNLGDPDIANVVQTFEFDPTFPGTYQACSVVAGQLVGTALDSFYGSDSAPFYGADADSFYEPSAYPDMVYTSGEIFVNEALAGSIMTLLFAYAGLSLNIEYRQVGAASFYGTDDSQPRYGTDDSDPFYDQDDAWLAWPGQIVAKHAIYQFRFTIGGSTLQPSLSMLQVVIDAPDIDETLSNLVIPSTGIVIPYASSFTLIAAVQCQLQANLSGAITIEVDKTDPLHPKLFAYNVSHVAVSGAQADVTLEGY